MLEPEVDLLGLANSFNDAAQAIDDFVGRQTDPYSIQCRQLRTKEQAIVDCAIDFSHTAIAGAAEQIQEAIDQLQVQVDLAQSRLRTIGNLKVAISIAAAVLAAAAGVATGGGVASVPAILNLVSTVSAAINATGD
jgi:hypothetical protein